MKEELKNQNGVSVPTNTQNQEDVKTEVAEIQVLEKKEDLVSLSQTAQEKVEAIQKIKMAMLRLTNKSDWQIFSDKPRLTEAGVKRLIMLLGISYKIIEMQRVVEEDGEYSYVVKIKAWWKGIEIEDMGTANSKDPFVRVRKDNQGKKIELPLKLVDENNVRKKAIANACQRVLTSLLGLKNLSIDELRQAGIELGATIEFKKKKEEKKEEKEEAKEKEKQKIDKENEEQNQVQIDDEKMKDEICKFLDGDENDPEIIFTDGNFWCPLCNSKMYDNRQIKIEKKQMGKKFPTFACKNPDCRWKWNEKDKIWIVSDKITAIWGRVRVKQEEDLKI